MLLDKADHTEKKMIPSVGHQESVEVLAEKSYSYDQNGNIKALRRTDGYAKTIDSLTYDYSSNGNQLRSVSDGRDIINGFFDGNITGDDYTYDANGNMITDKNKNIASITYNHLNLPNKVTKGTAESIVYTYDAGGRKLTQKVYNTSNILTKTTDYLGEYIYQNDTLQFINHEEGRIVTKPLAAGENGVRPEYQFHLKDHLGNVRTTFTTARNVDTPVATFETSNQTLEQSQFLRYDDARLVNSTLFDHTRNGVTSYSQRLSGSANEKTGIARSISVMPGDTVNLEVYAKWVDTTNPNNTAALMQLIGPMIAGAPTPGTVIDGANYTVNGITPFPYTGMAGEGSSTGTGPKAFMNYLIFDRNFVFVNGGYVRMTTDGKEDGTNVAHQKLSAQVIITQPGYLYTYLSNEEPSPKEVYFDDFTIQQIKSPVVQQEDFYPFGLTFNSYSRENSIKNRYLFNGGSERQDDLGLNWDYTFYRTYDPAIGIFMQIDPKVDDFYDWTPYNYAYDDPAKNNDPNGDCPLCAVVGAAVGAAVGGAIEAGSQLIEHGEVNDWGAVGGAALQGGITGGVAGLTGGASLLVTGTASVAANVAGGALNNAVQGKEITVGTVTKDAALGAGGAVLGKVGGALINKLSPAAKGQIGEVATQAKYLAKGFVSEGKSVVATGAKTATGKVQVAKYDHAMKNVFTGKKLTVESKFNGASLTGNQKAAASKVTTTGGLIVDRTTSGQVGNTAAGVATGSTSSQIKKD